MKLKNTSKSVIFAIAAVCLWSTVATAFKIALRYQSPDELLFLATVFSLFFFGLYLLVKKTAQVQLPKPLDLLKSALAGLLNPFLYYLVLFYAYDLLPAQIAQPLNYSWVIVISALSVIVLKQKIRIIEFVTLVLGLIGVFIIASKGNLNLHTEFNEFGVFLAIGSSVLWGIYWIININDKRDAVEKLFWSFAFGAMYIWAYRGFDFPELNLNMLLSSIYVGLFEMGITFILWLKALQLSDDNARIGMIVFLSPFLSLFIIHFVLGENIEISTIIGLALIIFGAVLRSLSKKLLS